MEYDWNRFFGAMAERPGHVPLEIPIRSAAAADNLPPAPVLNTCTIRGLDGMADVTHCHAAIGEGQEISVSLTSTGAIPDNTVVSFSPAAALALAYALIAQVDAACPRPVAAAVAAKVVKIVPGRPGRSTDAA